MRSTATSAEGGEVLCFGPAQTVSGADMSLAETPSGLSLIVAGLDRAAGFPGGAVARSGGTAGGFSGAAGSFYGAVQWLDGMAESFHGTGKWFYHTEEWFDGTEKPFRGTEESFYRTEESFRGTGKWLREAGFGRKHAENGKYPLVCVWVGFWLSFALQRAEGQNRSP